jgi:hypothetical protein
MISRSKYRLTSSQLSIMYSIVSEALGGLLFLKHCILLEEKPVRKRTQHEHHCSIFWRYFCTSISPVSGVKSRVQRSVWYIALQERTRDVFHHQSNSNPLSSDEEYMSVGSTT